MNEQPEALRLADELAIQNQYDFYKVCEEAADELRRLYAENEQLRDAVIAEREACAAACEARKIIDPEYEYDRHYNQGAEHCASAIRARGEQEQPR